MKYCAKCGTQMSDDTMVCPQCHPEINNQQPQTSNQTIPTKKNASNKIIPLISANIILSALTLIILVILHFIPSSSNNPTNDNNNSDLGNTNSNIYSSTCPEDEHGNHDWAPAKCTEPAQCYNCNTYRDDKLGNHSFYTDDDGFCDCTYCGILYEVYMDSLE